MKTETKILFTDLDGTLLDDKKNITPGNLAAIQEALSQGHKIVISTGRALQSAITQAEILGLTMPGCYLIAFDGANIYDIHEQRLIFSQSLCAEYVAHLFREAHKVNLHIHAYDENGVLSEHDTEDLRIYCDITKLPYRIVPDIAACLPHGTSKVLACDYRHREPLVAFQEQIAAWAPGKVDTFFSSDALLEIVGPGISKGSAILRLCEILDFPIEQTISAGDAENDISMLQTTAVSVVMKNAGPHMHPYASYITEHDNNHDGIAEVIHKFMLTGGTL